ncbi:HK97 family phage prohead protease [Novosphingobium sp. KN65.2]|uniref:HK97 family phage prohead protease n=1 Tax=Novosphingobium sp. KN65.2 TaxID=1478134 RepID=UPI0005DF5848|nr:HK97 family phage prohead protease [Novosphingobium sp. KN65.2]CDO37137.1 Phage head maturation protease [Novosphingobium sp. KN65.2]
MQHETRALTIAPELRAENGVKTARGYAAIFNSRTTIGGWFTEVIAPGAFTDTLRSADVRALIDHDTGRVIGRSSVGTLRLSEDEKGLFVEIDLPDTTDGRDLAVQLERGDISGMSFGFRVPLNGDDWSIIDGMDARTINKLELIEVSAVAFPQYTDTEIALRSRDDAKDKAEAQRKLAADANRQGFSARTLAREADQEQRFRRIS